VTSEGAATPTSHSRSPIRVATSSGPRRRSADAFLAGYDGDETTLGWTVTADSRRPHVRHPHEEGDDLSLELLHLVGVRQRGSLRLRRLVRHAAEVGADEALGGAQTANETLDCAGLQADVWTFDTPAVRHARSPSRSTPWAPAAHSIRLLDRRAGRMHGRRRGRQLRVHVCAHRLQLPRGGHLLGEGDAQHRGAFAGELHGCLVGLHDPRRRGQSRSRSRRTTSTRGRTWATSPSRSPARARSKARDGAAEPGLAPECSSRSSGRTRPRSPTD
jgi:hypothetical protein